MAFYSIKIQVEAPEIKILIVALISQARNSECGMAQTISCIAGFNVLNMRYVRTNAGNQGLSHRSHIYPFGGAHLRDGNCPREGDCPNDSDHSIDGGYPCLLESSVSICHLIQYCEISLKKVGDHPWGQSPQNCTVAFIGENF